MDWAKVKKIYPTSYKLFDKWNKKRGKFDFFNRLDNLRDLYDFFDDQGLYISVIPVYLTKNIKWTFGGFGYCMNDDDLDVDPLYDTRIEAEKIAFSEAFKIIHDRETYLKNHKKKEAFNKRKKNELD